MTTDDEIRDEKLQYDIDRETAKISALSSRKINKYEYLTGEVILPPDQRRVISIWKANKSDWWSRKKINEGTWRTWETTT